ncbi:MAG: hypothetical protein ACXAC7_20305, partial [Candidatus Hodarchaeales archaeon]
MVSNGYKQLMWMSDAILGIDEAGRGSVIGPLVIGAVIADQSAINGFKLKQVKDSKKLSGNQRLSLKDFIMKNAKKLITKYLSPELIDQALKNRFDNLNLLEIRIMADIVLNNPTSKVYIDAVGKPPYFLREIKKILDKNSNIKKIRQIKSDKLVIYWNIEKITNNENDQEIVTKLIAQNKADDKYVIV